MPKTYYLDSAMINAALRQIAYTPPTGSWVALYTVSPTVSGGGVEVSVGGYSRQSAVWSAPVNGQSSSTADIVFPVASAPWGTIVAFGLLDAGTAGNLLYFAPLNAPQVVATMDQVKFPAGQLQVIEG